jgi:RHS repeat-associated protein
MGEKFGANPSTGTGSLTVPLATSEGRAGFAPRLSLAYDSGSGNGPFGFGWSLSLPSVTRKTDKGLPRYLDDEESDTFLISGAEDLVPVLDGAGLRVELQRTWHKVAYKVRPYRPRIEGMFSRVERWTRDDDGTSHWRAITRDNVTTLFGFDENSRVFDHDSPRRVFSYLIAFTYDDKGNATRYVYTQEDSRGVDARAAHEAQRTEDGRKVGRYLKYVCYGNVEPYFPDWSADGDPVEWPSDWHFQVVFDYGDHDADAPGPEPDLDWPVRPDPFSTYRGGFEVRTYRRCARVLLFHKFEGQAGFDVPALVRSTDFRYSDEDDPADPRNPAYTFLSSVTQTGYRQSNGATLRRSAPPLEFSYTQAEIQAEVLTLEDAESRANLPEGLDGTRFRWIDLDGEGLPGVLSEQYGGWGYKRNLSPLNSVTLPGGARVVRAQFGPQERVPTLPAPASLSGGQQLIDLDGAGRLDLASFDAHAPGFFARTADEGWLPFKTFSSLPNLDWSEPNLKFVDLTGDGRADLLITEDEVFTFYPSLGADGFGPQERVFTPPDEAKGPRVVFADGTQTVSLADMSGDGLSDIVRVRNGEVCYWPNLGYGRFGARVTMDGAPRFGDDERFDARRVRLADVDGSGTTDLLYVGDDGVRLSFNRSGNSFAEPHLLAVFPGADDLSAVQAADLLGNGTACLVWSSPLPGEAHAALRYVDLMGSRKPHLLARVRNNLGSETRLTYAPSTRFYLEDKRAGRPWVTRLPFPVHVVERVESYDWISRSRSVTRYAYHHGYFDGAEREFRGFGLVEQWDTETERDDTLFPEAEPLNEDASSFSPPVFTRTWFHTGAFVEAGTVSRQYAHEYWVEPSMRGDSPAAVAAREALLLPDTMVAGGLIAEEMREAYRALKGSPLRVEVYALDGTARAEHPYTVTETNYTVRRLQPRGPNLHAVFHTHPRESVVYHYERQPDDPRVAHEVTLEVDDFGDPLRTASIGYGRRQGYAEPEPELAPSFRSMLAYDQTRLHVTATQHAFTLPVNAPADANLFDAYRAPLPSETTKAELTGITPASALFSFEELDAHYTELWGGAHDIPYEEVATADVAGGGTAAPFARRVVARSRTLYRRDDMTALLPLGLAQSNALPGESYALALTESQRARVFGQRVGDADMLAAGYVRPPGESDWWSPGGRVFYSPGDADAPAVELAEARAHFYQVRRKLDPFGAITRVAWDAYDLLLSVSTDALGNVTAAANDYRVLLPFRLTDPNGNHSEVAFDCLGKVAGTALSGKAGEGDTLAGFEPDLADAAIQALFADPLNDPDALLGGATSRTVFDLFAYFRTRDLPMPQPAAAYTLTRETHASDLGPGQTTRHQHAFSYSDGFGRIAQHKAQAEPGPVAGHAGEVSPRWVGSGWTIYNNKGKPVRKYEPFFTATHRFEFDRQAGVSSVLFYDPVGRAVATLHPDNTFEKTVFDAWRQTIWDANDTSLVADPRADSDAGDFFKRLLGDAPDAFTSWHDLRIAGTFGADAAERDANRDAAQKAAAHAETPTTAHLDAIGRVCMSVADNGVDGGAAQRYATRTAVDTEGKPLAVFDALGRHVLEHCVREPSGGGGFVYVAGHDLAGRELYQNGVDGGERRTLNNVVGNQVCSWDARGFTFRLLYDALHRLTHRYATPPSQGEVLLERLVYGEAHPEAARNLKGRLYRHYDGAGVAVNERYDFKGNLTESARQIAALVPPAAPAAFYDTAPDWSPLADITETPALDLAALDAAAAPLLTAPDRFAASTLFDALNRPVQLVTPHTAAGLPSVVQPSYNEAGLLEHVDVWLRLQSSPAALLDAATADAHALTDLDYNARGQRLMCAHGNGTVTAYDYDPLTFRLRALTTTRPPTFDADARAVQALAYTYDPAGNVTRVVDTADIQNVVFFRNQRVEPSSDYTYDPLYRLKRATGREHLGQNGGVLNAPQQVTDDDSLRAGLDSPGDGNAMGNYAEQYEYDPAGNILRMIHQVAGGGWTRRYSYGEVSRVDAAETGNRLSATSLPGDDPQGPYSAHYAYDEHGNTNAMPHLPRMTWGAHDQLQSVTRQQVNSGMPETTYYFYDAGGERVRKATYRQAAGGATPSLKSERLYLGALEIYREYDGGGALSLERETLHVTDEKRRVALVETRTAGQDAGPPRLVRYQLVNHLDSASLELDDKANVISYEEYFPYGATSYQAVRAQTETPKRYRYTGKERDEESGFYYHGARYYAPWLGRWTSPDPAGFKDSLSLYVYVACSPTNLHDPTGHQGKKPDPWTKGGLTVSPQSKISAKQWLEMIQRSDKLTPWMKSVFKVEGDTIVLVPEKFKQVPKGENVPEWFLQAATAIRLKEWHLTTGLTVLKEEKKGTQSVGQRLVADVEPGDDPVATGLMKPEGLVLGETIPSESMKAMSDTTPVARKMLDTNAQGGTVKGARRGRGTNTPAEGLIVVSNRGRETKDAGNVVARSEEAMLETLFHELAAHASPLSQGQKKESEHFKNEVDWHTTPVTEADNRAKAVWDFFGQPKEAIKAIPPDTIWDRARKAPSKPNIWERTKLTILKQQNQGASP